MTYAAAFHWVTQHINWGDTTLTAQFYKGLKNEVKNEIAWIKWPESLQEMIEQVVVIDNRGYERHLERRDNVYQSLKKEKLVKKEHYDIKLYYSLMPMEVDSMTRNTQFQKKKSFIRGKSKRNCYTCGISEHFTEDCWWGKIRATPSMSKKAYATGKKMYTAALKEPASLTTPSHTSMLWTACYNDSCSIHHSDKDGSGWYPQKRTQVKMFTMIKKGKEKDQKQTHFPEHEDINEEEISEEDVLEKWENWEVSETSICPDFTQDETQPMSLEGSSLFHQEWQDNWDSLNVQSFQVLYDKIFQVYQQWQDFKEFDNKLALIEERVYQTIHEICAIHETRTRTEEVPREIIKNVILETPLKGSAFTWQGGYIMSERIHIPQSLRMKVWNLWTEYTRLAQTIINPADFNFVRGEVQFTTLNSKN